MSSSVPRPVAAAESTDPFPPEEIELDSPRFGVLRRTEALPGPTLLLNRNQILNSEELPQEEKNCNCSKPAPESTITPSTVATSARNTLTKAPGLCPNFNLDLANALLALVVESDSISNSISESSATKLKSDS